MNKVRGWTVAACIVLAGVAGLVWFLIRLIVEAIGG